MSVFKHKGILSFLSCVGILALLSGTAALAEGEGGYSGLIAPPKKEKTSPTSTKTAPPSGYSGLIPGTSQGKQGTVAGTNTDTKKSKDVAQPPLPGAKTDYPSKFKAVDLDPPQQSLPENPHSIQTAEDIQFIAALTAPVEGDPVKKLLSGSDIRLPERTLKILSKPQAKKDGLWPLEHMTKMNIDLLFQLLNKKERPPAEQKKMIDDVHRKLKEMQEALYLRTETPDIIYESLGLPENYVTMEKESLKGSIQIVELALENLQKYK